jgi:LPPG:FO 2-phospho-L-lactate transferase
MRATVLAGGVGGSKLLSGLAQELDPAELTAIVNTGDDIELHGLKISPDLDIVTYTLAGRVDTEQGWGFLGDTFACMETLRGYGRPTWFRLGDRDLATHLFRTEALRRGGRLTEVTEAIRRALGVGVRILPMTDDPVGTHILIADGGPVRSVHFQEYLVERGAKDPVRGVEFQGSVQAHPTAEVCAALSEAEAVIVAPSNPVASIGPILAIAGIRRRLAALRVPVVVVSPIVGGRSLKGPTDAFLRWAGADVSPLGVARHYQSVLGNVSGMLVDESDARLVPEIEGLGIRVQTGDLVMRDVESKRRVARMALQLGKGS